MLIVVGSAMLQIQRYRYKADHTNLVNNFLKLRFIKHCSNKSFAY
jgi:hypothetical protein